MSLPYDKRGRGMCLNCNDNFYVFPYHNIWQNNACSSKKIVNTNSLRFKNRTVFQWYKKIKRAFNSNHVLQKMDEQQILTKAQTKQMFV